MWKLTIVDDYRWSVGTVFKGYHGRQCGAIVGSDVQGAVVVHVKVCVEGR
ncbi:hypothetical protein AG1IA_04503 [Rhizoctonia solani AG-1 IA]|uniref:Uncharacterized protein n=1 Tax=Thanatephorus cucumeris (strain AG1-IA) TaxID=983506 RepID=L8WTZ6_THACA|nr:hypothetical protein AG1IA_04503 [Rhizoctonia solani AG-1 IA]